MHWQVKLSGGLLERLVGRLATVISPAYLQVRPSFNFAILAFLMSCCMLQHNDFYYLIFR